MLTLDKENCQSFHANTGFKKKMSVFPCRHWIKKTVKDKNKMLSTATGHRLQTWSLTHISLYQYMINACYAKVFKSLVHNNKSLGWFAAPPPQPPQLALSSYLLAKTLFWQLLIINIWSESHRVIYFCLVFYCWTKKVIFHNITAKTCPVSGDLPVNSVKCSISSNRLISLTVVILSVNLSVQSILIHC